MDNQTSYEEQIMTVVYNYLLISFGALVVNYVAHVCFNTSAERQSKQMRFVSNTMQTNTI